MQLASPLYFDRRSLVVRLTLTLNTLQKFPEPDKLIGEARLMMAGLKAQGVLAHFEVDSEGTERLWHLARTKAELFCRPVTWIVAAGYPDLDGVEFDPARADDVLGHLSIQAPSRVVARWHPRWLKHALEACVRSGGRVLDSDVQAAWIRAAAHGEEIRSFPVHAYQEDLFDNRRTAMLIASRPSSLQVDLFVSPKFAPWDDLAVEALAEETARRLFALQERQGASAFHRSFLTRCRRVLQRAPWPGEWLLEDKPRALLAGIVLQGSVDWEKKTLLACGDRLPSGQRTHWRECIRKHWHFPDQDGKREPAADGADQVKPWVHDSGFVAPMNIDRERFRDFITPAQAFLQGAAKGEWDLQAMTLAIHESEAQDLQKELHKLASALLMAPRRGGVAKEAGLFTIQFFPFTREEHATAPAEADNESAQDADWHIPVIREMFGLKTFRLDDQWIASRLEWPMTQDQVKRTIKYLKDRGLVIQDQKTRRYVPAASHIRTQQNVQSASMLQFHRLMMRMGIEAVERITPSRNFIFCAPLALTEQELATLKTTVYRDLALIFERFGSSRQANQIYQLNVQWLPYISVDPNI